VKLRLTPRETSFYDLFAEQADNLIVGAALLTELLGAGGAAAAGERTKIAERMRNAEHTADESTHKIYNLLNSSFITPFDREDIYNLAGAIDDVCDHVDEAAGNIAGYGVQSIREPAKQQAEVILRSAEKLDDAVGLLEGFKDAGRQLHELRDLEDEGDRLNRTAVAELFSSEQDPLVVIRWKDIHEQLEEAVDACENAADVLEAILVKNR
jgi:uncharacterized protein